MAQDEAGQRTAGITKNLQVTVYRLEEGDVATPVPIKQGTAAGGDDGVGSGKQVGDLLIGGIARPSVEEAAEHHASGLVQSVRIIGVVHGTRQEHAAPRACMHYLPIRMRT